MPIFDNKQLMHMAAESVILVVILFYFSFQNKKLAASLNICTKRLKEQEKILQKHDTVLQNHDMILRNLVQGKPIPKPPMTKPPTSKPPTSKPPTSKPPMSSSEKLPSSPEKVKIPDETTPTIEVIEKELVNELKELEPNTDKKKKEDN